MASSDPTYGDPEAVAQRLLSTSAEDAEASLVGATANALRRVAYLTSRLDDLSARVVHQEDVIDRQITQLRVDAAQQKAAIEALVADVKRINVAVAVILTHEPQRPPGPARITTDEDDDSYDPMAGESFLG